MDISHLLNIPHGSAERDAIIQNLQRAQERHRLAPRAHEERDRNRIINRISAGSEMSDPNTLADQFHSEYQSEEVQEQLAKDVKRISKRKANVQKGKKARDQARIDQIKDTIKQLDYYYPQSYRGNEFGGLLYEGDVGFNPVKPNVNGSKYYGSIKGKGGCSCCKGSSIEIQPPSKRPTGGSKKASAKQESVQVLSSPSGLFVDNDGVLEVKKPKTRKKRSDKGKPHAKSEWQQLVSAVYAKVKPQGMSYSDALKTASALRKKGMTAKDLDKF